MPAKVGGVMTSAACTICNGPYWWGAGALANSLYKTGYKGEFWVGYTGELPDWLKASNLKENRYHFAPDFIIVLHKLSAEVHLAHQKPDLMLTILDARPDLGGVMFFDADMVTLASFSFFESWIDGSVGVVLDHGGSPYLHQSHPWRKEWSRLIEELGWVVRPSSQYFQSAFCGVPRKYKVFLERWRGIISAIHKIYPDCHEGVLFKTRSHPYHIVDQDAMSIAVMATDVPLTVMGVEALGNGQMSYLAQHPRTHLKPWTFGFIRRAFAGWGPVDPYELLFLQHCRGLIDMMSAKQQRRRIFELRIGRVIHRFYRI